MVRFICTFFKNEFIYDSKITDVARVTRDSMIFFLLRSSDNQIMHCHFILFSV